MLLLMIFYTNFCIRSINGNKDKPYTKKNIIVLVILCLISIGFMVIKWIIG